MTDYTKTVDFAAKDALASGEAAKVVKGTEHDTEYNNIATAIATKAEKQAGITSGNVVEIDGDGQMADSGVAGSNVADVSGSVAFEAEVGFDGLVANGNSGSSKTIDWTAGNMQTLLMTADCTLTFTDPGVGGTSLTFWVKKSSDYQITWPAEVLWPNGVEPELESGVAWDIFVLKWSGSNYFGMQAPNFS